MYSVFGFDPFVGFQKFDNSSMLGSAIRVWGSMYTT